MHRALLVAGFATVLSLATVARAPAAGLTCAESGETPGVIEAVMEGTHPRSGTWEVIAAGTVTAVAPHNGDYGTWGADVTLQVRYWLRGDGGSTLEFYDPPAGSSGIGFEVGADYLVLASHNDAEDRLETFLCDLTYRLENYERVEQLANRFGATIPDTAVLTAPAPLSIAGWVLVAIAGGAWSITRRTPVI